MKPCDWLFGRNMEDTLLIHCFSNTVKEPSQRQYYSCNYFTSGSEISLHSPSRLLTSDDENCTVQDYPNWKTWKMLLSWIVYCRLTCILNRPGVAMAVLQTPSSFIDSLIQWSFSSTSSNYTHSKTVGPRDLKFFRMFIALHVSNVTCHMSHVTCKMVELVGGGSVISGPTPSSSEHIWPPPLGLSPQLWGNHSFTFRYARNNTGSRVVTEKVLLQ